MENKSKKIREENKLPKGGRRTRIWRKKNKTFWKEHSQQEQQRKWNQGECALSNRPGSKGTPLPFTTWQVGRQASCRVGRQTDRYEDFVFVFIFFFCYTKFRLQEKAKKKIKNFQKLKPYQRRQLVRHWLAVRWPDDHLYSHISNAPGANTKQIKWKKKNANDWHGAGIFKSFLRFHEILDLSKQSSQTQNSAASFHIF